MKFFKTLLAATLGTLLALFLIFIILIVMLASTGGEPEPYMRDNTVLKMNISGSLPSRVVENPIEDLLSQSEQHKVSLETLKSNLTKAAADEHIRGVLLEIDFLGEGWANLQEAYRMISQFRDSTDKFIYATTNDAGFNEKGYYLASATDSVFSPPESFFEFDGFYNQVTFYDGLFEKLGVETEITRHGKYKGAVEPYFRKDLSESNAYQLNQILEDVSGEFLTAVSAKSGKSISELNSMLNEVPHITASFGYEQGLLDSLLYANQLDSLINRRLQLDDGDSYNTISTGRYTKVSNKSAGIETAASNGEIGVIYASGPIMPTAPDFGSQEIITATWFKKQLKQATDDDDVKALVIRLNSPGGSGSTSDAIWNMIQQTRKTMPVIVSMGPVAASGGYYIAMAADSIVAEPTTITGSIGVFATKFNAKQLFNDELGITFDEVKSHDHADWLLPTRSFTPSEEKAFQAYVDQFYDTFITKVAESRGLTKQQVDDIAQGRVWTGIDAQEQNLVDVMGGLDDALQIAADKAGLTAYSTESYPKPKELFEFLMGATEGKVEAMMDQSFLGSKYTEEMRRQMSFLKRRDAMLLFPYKITIE